MHELYVNGKKITPIIGSLTWSSNEDALGVQLSFNVAYANIVDIGNLVLLKNGDKEIFRGIVTTEEINGEYSISYIAFDFAFYLNKSKGVYQFNNVKASNAIVRLLNDFNITIGNIASINTIINYIYFDKVISDILKDILQQSTNETGIKYRLEMREGKLFIEKQSDLVINATFKLASNLAAKNITNAISNPTRRRSIEEMKNSIIVISNNNDVVRTEAIAKDEQSISNYGLLQEVQTVEDKDIAQSNNIANTLLKEFNRIFEENSIETIGNDAVRAGRILNINEPKTGMNGNYRIKSCTHTVNNGIHRMNLDLGVV